MDFNIPTPKNSSGLLTDKLSPPESALTQSMKELLSWKAFRECLIRYEWNPPNWQKLTWLSHKIAQEIVYQGRTAIQKLDLSHLYCLPANSNAEDLFILERKRPKSGSEKRLC